MEEVRLYQEPPDLWMECEEDEDEEEEAWLQSPGEDHEHNGGEEVGVPADSEEQHEVEKQQEEQPMIIPIPTDPPEEHSINQSPSGTLKCVAAPPAFKVNGSLIQRLPPTGVQLQLSFHPGGSSSGFARILVPDALKCSSSLRASPPPAAPPAAAAASAFAPLTPVITGVVSGEAAYRVLTNHSEATTLPQATSTLTRQAAPHRLLLKGQLKASFSSSSPPPACSTCSSSYKFVPDLRGFLCLCSPIITQSLRNLRRQKQRRSRETKSRCKTPRDPRPARKWARTGPGPEVGHQTGLGPISGLGSSLSPGQELNPGPETGPEQCSVNVSAHRLPLMEKQLTGISASGFAVSPKDFLLEGVQQEEQEEQEEQEDSPLQPQQSKLVIMVEDFYYGSAPGQEPVNQSGGVKKRHHGPYSCLYCRESVGDNIQLMSHIQGHVTSQDSQQASLPSCTHCFRPFLSSFKLQRHIEDVHGQCQTTAQCKICELAFDSEPTFLWHMKVTHKPGEMPYACQVCGFRSSFHYQLCSHFKQRHGGSGLLLCLYCLRVLSSSNCYQQHVARHQRKQVFSCRKCRLHFLYVRERVEHQRLHHGTHVRPPQLSRLPPGTKVTVRTYSAVGEANHRKSLKRPPPCKVVDVDPPPLKQEVMPGRPVQSLGPLVVSLGHHSGAQRCLECLSLVLDFSSHFPSLVRCSICRFLTCCSTAYANHMINNHATHKPKSPYHSVFQTAPRLPYSLRCVSCSLVTCRGDVMASHLAERKDHRCLLLTQSECGPSQMTPPQDDSHLTLPAGGGGFLPIHLLSSSGGSTQLSIKPLPSRPVYRGPPAMMVQVLGPRPLSEQVSASPLSPPQLPFPPLSTPELSALVLALTHGPHHVSRHLGVALPTLHSWATQLWEGVWPWDCGRGSPRRAWPWRTGRLAEWLLGQREQQGATGPDALLQVAQQLLGSDSLLSHRLAWTAHFLLRHDLGLQPIGPPTGGRLPSCLLDKSQAFIHLLAAQVKTRAHHLVACMDEFSVWLDVAKFSQQDPAALRLTGAPGETPLFSVVLSGLADGTFLPPLLFFSGSVPLLPHGFPTNVLLEARPGGVNEQDLQQTWIKRVWRPHLSSQRGALLVVDVHRGHLAEEFRKNLSSASTSLLFIPSGCSSRLQPLHICIMPALRDFLQARWVQLVSQGSLDGLGLEELSLTVACWLSEVSSALSSGTDFLHRSFSSVCRQEVLEDRGEAASMTEALLEALAPPTDLARPCPMTPPDPTH